MEENKDEKVLKKKKKSNLIKGTKLIPLCLIVIIIVIAVISQNKTGKIETKVKSMLDRVVEKSELETATITYNVIAKECKDEQTCDKSSNNIKDFKYVVSCKGTVSAGIDFKDVKIDVDEAKKNVIIHMPQATIKGEPNILSTKFLNGNELPASEITNARKLCQETTKERSEIDNKLIPAATEQARIVLEEFYNQWIKVYDSSYTIEVR